MHWTWTALRDDRLGSMSIDDFKFMRVKLPASLPRGDQRMKENGSVSRLHLRPDAAFQKETCGRTKAEIQKGTEKLIRVLELMPAGFQRAEKVEI